MEQLDYNLLYRWFVGLGVDESVWVPTVFTTIVDLKGDDRLPARLRRRSRERRSKVLGSSGMATPVSGHPLSCRASMV